MLVNAYKLKQIPIVLSEQDTGKITKFHFDDLFWNIRHIGIEVSGNNKINFIVVSRFQIGDQKSDSKFFPLYKQSTYGEKSQTSMELKRATELSLTQRYEVRPLVKIRQGKVNEQRLYETYNHISPSNEFKDYHYMQAHLHELRAIMSSDVICSNMKTGRIEDAIIETNNWKIRYLVVHAAAAANQPEKDLLISPTWIKKIEWQYNDVHLNLNKEAILNSPAYDPEMPITNDFELKILRYYSYVRSSIE